MREVEMYSTIEDAVKMVVATKIDLVRLLPICIVPTEVNTIVFVIAIYLLNKRISVYTISFT